MGGSMKNILLWAGIAVLAFQDSFKKKPVKPTRSQQFFQTGATSQAFIEGTNSIWSKILKLYKKNVVVDDDGYTYLIMPRSIAKKIFDLEFIQILAFYVDSEAVIETDEDWYYAKRAGSDVGVEDLNYLLEIVFKELYNEKGNEDYLKLSEIASGDWELAYEIAKGQGLL